MKSYPHSQAGTCTRRYTWEINVLGRNGLPRSLPDHVSFLWGLFEHALGRRVRHIDQQIDRHSTYKQTSKAHRPVTMLSSLPEFLLSHTNRHIFIHSLLIFVQVLQKGWGACGPLNIAGLPTPPQTTWPMLHKAEEGWEASNTQRSTGDLSLQHSECTACSYN